VDFHAIGKAITCIGEIRSVALNTEEGVLFADGSGPDSIWFLPAPLRQASKAICGGRITWVWHCTQPSAL
jgi:hypothetical protein